MSTNPKANPNAKSFAYDTKDVLAGWIMPFVVKMFLDGLSPSRYDAIFSSKKHAWDAASITIPFLFRRFTHFSDFFDDLVGDFFEEVKREITRRNEGKVASKDENIFRIMFLETIMNKDPNEAQKLIKNFNDLFLNLNQKRKQDLIGFLSGLSDEQLYKFLSMDDETRKNFLNFLDINQDENGFDSVEKFINNMKNSFKKIDDQLNTYFNENGEFSKWVKKFGAKAQAYNDQSKKLN